jgi:phage major head subunit gpT-like protein
LQQSHGLPRSPEAEKGRFAMIITPESFALLTTAYSASFNKGFKGAENIVSKIALEAPSKSSQEIYAWIGQFPGMREWVGDRQIKNMNAYDYFIKNESNYPPPFPAR